TFLISTMFFVVTVIADVFAEAKRFGSFARASHLIGTVLALVVWRIAGGAKRLTPTALQWLDVAGTLGICWALGVMGYDAVQPYGYFTSLLAVTHVSITRAMIVPSIPNRTFWLAGASFAAIVVSCALMRISPDMVQTGATRARISLGVALWSTA